MAHIFVLDDVWDAAVLTQRILTRKGHQVTIFTDEHEALQYAMHNRVDLAILDINLKVTNGIAVLEELRRTTPATQVIMLTGYPTIETARQAQHLGVAGYCVKPIDKNELEEKVAVALSNCPQYGTRHQEES